jgi:hypothetical protein
MVLKLYLAETIFMIYLTCGFSSLDNGDGSVSRHGLILCTNSYSIKDIVKPRLMNVLRIRYRLECSLHMR